MWIGWIDVWMIYARKDGWGLHIGLDFFYAGNNDPILYKVSNYSPNK
jgi:hypothetical protein